MSDVNLSISKEVVTPIIKEKVNQIVLESLGGADEIVTMVLDHVLNQKVDSNGNISKYSSDNKNNWLDVVVTQQIKKAIQEELKEQIKLSSSSIREALIAHIRTKKGSNAVAKALMDGLESTFSSNWRSKINVSLEPIRGED